MTVSKYASLLGIVFTFVTGVCHATSLGFWDFRTTVKLAAIVARVKIVSTDTIYFDGSKSEVCGYRIRVNVEEPFKGPKRGEFTFYSGSDRDVLQGSADYFVIVNPRASSSAETVIDGKKCDIKGIEYAVNSFFQTVFPIQEDPESGQPEYVLISRHSPFTRGNFVGPYGYIETFGIENDRIYALGSWKKISADLRIWMESKHREQE